VIDLNYLVERLFKEYLKVFHQLDLIA